MLQPCLLRGTVKPPGFQVPPLRGLVPTTGCTQASDVRTGLSCRTPPTIVFYKAPWRE